MAYLGDPGIDAVGHVSQSSRLLCADIILALSSPLGHHGAGVKLKEQHFRPLDRPCCFPLPVTSPHLLPINFTRSALSKTYLTPTLSLDLLSLSGTDEGPRDEAAIRQRICGLSQSKNSPGLTVRCFHFRFCSLVEA
jgi:hypothetical protein